MHDEILEYTGNVLIKKDLKRLKKWSSLDNDIRNNHKIFTGLLTDNIIKSVFNYPRCEHITQKQLGEETAHFYKMRIAISSQKLSPSNGGRLIFAVLLNAKKFTPILVYGASEEGVMYSINDKKIPLKKSGLIKIIEEKLYSL